MSFKESIAGKIRNYASSLLPHCKLLSLFKTMIVNHLIFGWCQLMSTKLRTIAAALPELLLKLNLRGYAVFEFWEWIIIYFIIIVCQNAYVFYILVSIFLSRDNWKDDRSAGNSHFYEILSFLPDFDKIRIFLNFLRPNVK